VNAQEYLNRGNDLFNQNNYDGAIAEFTEALKIDPNFTVAKNNLSIAYYSRGLACYQNGDSEKAIEDIEKAAELNPEDDTYYGALGFIYDQIKDHTKENIEGIIVNFTKFINLNSSPKGYKYYSGHSSRASGYYKESKIYLQAGDFEKYIEFTKCAISDLEIAIEYEPNPANDNEIKQFELANKRLESMKSELESRKKVYEYSKTVKDTFNNL